MDCGDCALDTVCIIGERPIEVEENCSRLCWWTHIGGLGRLSNRRNNCLEYFFDVVRKTRHLCIFVRTIKATGL